jgi:hypothetical protein
MMTSIAWRSITICILLVTACSIDSPADPADPSTKPLANSEHPDMTRGSAEQSLAPQPNITTPPLFPVFGDGCRIKFWCHNDVAGGGPAFCSINNCAGTAPGHAASFCSNECLPGTNCNVGNIANFGPCG